MKPSVILAAFACALAGAALAVSLAHAGPRGAAGPPGSQGPQGPQGSPGVAQNLNGGYTSECHQLLTTADGSEITYYYPCSPVPQNPADQ